MSIKLGDLANMSNMKVGNADISKVCVGNTTIWQRVTTPYFTYTIGYAIEGEQAVCGGTPAGTETLYSASSSLQVGSTLFRDTALTTSYRGADLYYYSGTGPLYQISNMGIITAINNCVTSYPFQVAKGAGGANAVCGGTPSVFTQVYSDSSVLQNGTTLYTDAGLTTVFSGGNTSWYKGSEQVLLIINSVGVIFNVTVCSPLYSIATDLHSSPCGVGTVYTDGTGNYYATAYGGFLSGTYYAMGGETYPDSGQYNHTTYFFDGTSPLGVDQGPQTFACSFNP